MFVRLSCLGVFIALMAAIGRVPAPQVLSESQSPRAAPSTAVSESSAELLRRLGAAELREDALLKLIELGQADQIPIEPLAGMARCGSPQAQRLAYWVLSRKESFSPVVRAAMSRLAAAPPASTVQALTFALSAATTDQIDQLAVDSGRPGAVSFFDQSLAAATLADLQPVLREPGLALLAVTQARKPESATILELLRAIKSGGPDVWLACYKMGARAEELDASSPMTASVITALANAAEDEDARYQAISALVKIGRAVKAHGPGVLDPRVVPPLLAALDGKNVGVRSAAIAGFESYLAPSKALDGALLRCLDDPITRDQAMLILADRGRQDSIPFDALYKIVLGGDADARDVAFRILLARDVPSDELNRLVDALGTLDRRARAIKLLSAKGGSGIFRVAELAADPKLTIHHEAAQIFERLVRDKTSIPGLIKTLDSANPEARELAAEALGNFGPAAKSAVPALARHLADESGIVRLVSAYALEKIGPEARDALPALHKAAAGDDLALRTAAAHALPKIAQAAGSK